MKKLNNKSSEVLPHNSFERSFRKSSFSRIALQIFVWILVISFVSTIGVMWDGQAQGFPILIKTSAEIVDLSPQSIFMIERERIDQEIKSNNVKVDPRVYNNYLNNITLSNTTSMVLKQNLFKEIDLVPSSTVFAQIRNYNPMAQSNMINLQYAEQSFNSPLGVLFSIGMPSISDVYLYQDLKNFTIASEVISLNKTNFLRSQVTSQELEKYFNENLEKWLSHVIITELVVTNRSIARQVVTLLKEKDFNQTMNILKEDKQWQKDVVINDNVVVAPFIGSFDRFMSIVVNYKNKRNNTNQVIVSEPIYNKGKYYISIIDKPIVYESISPKIKSEMLLEYINQNYEQLSKNYNQQWNEAVQTFKKELAIETSFSSIANLIPGVVNLVTAPFSVIQSTLYSVTGQKINMPILSNSKLFEVLINTPENQNSDLIYGDKSQDSIFVFRPLEKKYVEIPVQSSQSAMMQQEVLSFKMNILNNSFGNSMKDRYNMKIYKDVLTNLTVAY